MPVLHAVYVAADRFACEAAGRVIRAKQAVVDGCGRSPRAQQVVGGLAADAGDFRIIVVFRDVQYREPVGTVGTRVGFAALRSALGRARLGCGGELIVCRPRRKSEPLTVGVKHRQQTVVERFGRKVEFRHDGLIVRTGIRRVLQVGFIALKAAESDQTESDRSNEHDAEDPFICFHVLHLSKNLPVFYQISPGLSIKRS